MFEPGAAYRTQQERPHEKADIEVITPFLERISWPQRCALCGAPNATVEKEVSDTFKSAEYVVAKKRSTITWKGVRLCDSCNRKTSLSALQIVLIAVGLVSGFVAFAVLTAINSSLICGWMVAGILIFGAFLLIATFGAGKKVEAFPVVFKVGTEGKELGKNRPTHYSFKFRNRSYSDEFRELNVPNFGEGYKPSF